MEIPVKKFFNNNKVAKPVSINPLEPQPKETQVAKNDPWGDNVKQESKKKNPWGRISS